MANTVYANFVLESKATDLLETKLNTRSLMTVDNSLTESAGMTKTINTYTYSGTAEELTVGAGNTNRGSITYTPANHTVKIIQQAFDYYDEDAMKDPFIVDSMMDGAAQVMVNKFNQDFFTAIAGASITHTATKLTYDECVDAIAKLNLEDESKLFILVGNDGKAALRKDPDYKAAQLGEVIYNGMVGTVAGVPVVVSKKVPASTAYIATPEAVKCFMKREVEVEQDRDADTRANAVYMRTNYITALVDATKVVKVTF